MKATEFLIQEHKLLLRALDVLDAMSAAIEEGKAVDPDDVAMVLDFLRWFGDAHHQAKEETILFPALKSAAASQGRSVEHMTLEHRQERALIEDLEKDLRLAMLPQFAVSANKLSSELRNHIHKEDQILFETVNEVLSPQQDDAAFAGLKQFDTELDKRALAEKTTGLHSLEWKYLRK